MWLPTGAELEQLFVSPEALAGFGQARAVTDAAGKLCACGWLSAPLPPSWAVCCGRRLLCRATPVRWRTTNVPFFPATWPALTGALCARWRKRTGGRWWWSPRRRILADYNLAVLDCRPKPLLSGAAVGAIPQTVLAAPGAATVEALLAQLRTGVELLYLIARRADRRCAASLAGGRSGQGQRRLRRRTGGVAGQLAVAPRLVVLASCQAPAPAIIRMPAPPVRHLGHGWRQRACPP